jgi:hypothetical protein
VGLTAIADKLEDIIGQVNKAMESNIVIGDIVDNVIDSTGKKSVIFNWFTYATQGSPTSISWGKNPTFDLTQMARLQIDTVVNVLKSLNINLESPVNQKAIMSVISMKMSRQTIGANAGQYMDTARIILGLEKDDPVAVLHGSKLITAGPSLGINKKALSQALVDIEDKEAIIITETLQHANMIREALKNKAKTVFIIGEHINLTPEQKATTISIGPENMKMASKYAKQFGLAAGIDMKEIDKMINAGLVSEGAAKTIFESIKDKAADYNATIIEPNIVPRETLVSSISDITAPLRNKIAHDTIPWLGKDMWESGAESFGHGIINKNWFGVAGGLFLAGGLMRLVHGTAARMREGSEPEEYVPLSQKDRSVYMMNEGAGYNRETTSPNETQPPVPPGTMGNIEPQTSIIVNQQDYVNTHQLNRMLTRHFQSKL